MADEVYLLTAVAETHPGRKRANNEDYVAFFEPTTEEDLRSSGALYIVADGVGGAAKGERASQFAAQKVLYEYYRRTTTPPPERLAQVMQEAGNEIYRYSQEQGRFTRMATTMVAAAFVGRKLVIANVGDSRAYLLRGGRVRQITRDHNLVGEMMREGLLTEEEALHSSVKNRLTRSLGGEPDPKVDLFEVALQPGDRIVLCSDGLTRYALQEDIVRMAGHGKPQEVVQRLIDFANWRGGADNISVIVVDVGPAVTPQQWVQQKARTQQPALAAVDLDTIVTQPLSPSTPRRPQRWWTQSPFNDWRLWVLVVGVFVLMCGVSVLGVAALWGRNGSPSLPPTATVPVVVLPSVPPQKTPAPPARGSLGENIPTRPPVAPEEGSPPPASPGAPGGKGASPSPPPSSLPSGGCFAKIDRLGVEHTLKDLGYLPVVTGEALFNFLKEQGFVQKGIPTLIYLPAPGSEYKPYGVDLNKDGKIDTAEEDEIQSNVNGLILLPEDRKGCENLRKKYPKEVRWITLPKPLPAWAAPGGSPSPTATVTPSATITPTITPTATPGS